MNTTLRESVSHWLAASISLIPPWRATLSSRTTGGGARVNAERACSVSTSHDSRVGSLLNIAAVARLGFGPIILDDHRRPRSWKATLRQSKNRGPMLHLCDFQRHPMSLWSFFHMWKGKKQRQESRTPHTSIPVRVSRLPLALASVN